MSKLGLPAAALLALATSVAAQSNTKVAAYISAANVQATIAAASEGRVSDQQIRHVDAGDGNLGVGVVQRPAQAAGVAVGGIQHHNQAEIYHVVSGSGTFVTSDVLVEARPLDPDGEIVLTLTGPSSVGRIEGGQSRPIKAGDILIIPAGTAHGFREVTETITYLVFRVDSEKLVKLK